MKRGTRVTPNTEQPAPEFWVISTIREAEYENYKSLLALENEKAHYFACPLAVLDPSEDIPAYQTIIENPARLRGIRVEPELTKHLLSVITELKNPLPKLEYTLHELYVHAVKTHALNEGLTLAAFKDERIIGSMSGLITRNAQALLDELKKDSGIRKRIPEFFSLLLGVDKTHSLAYPNPAKIEAFKKTPELYRLYQAFVNHRFLLESDKNVRFSHEVLIREWSEVQAWAKETAQREQKRKTRNLVVGLVFSIGLIFIASYAAYYANQQSDKAKEERDKALITESRFLANLSLGHTESGYPRLGALLALEALPDYSKKEDQWRPVVPEAQRSLYATLNQYMDRLWLTHSKPVVYAAFSPDGSQIVTASRDKTARVWDAETGQVVAILKGHISWVVHAAFSPDGSQIVTVSHDKPVLLWTTDTGQVVAVLKGHTDWVNHAAFSPDGSQIVTASYDKTARVWDAETGQVVAVLKGHTNWVIHAAFSPDGSQIVTASHDNTARVWDAEQVVAVLKGHTLELNYAAFSPDGSKVVTACNDNTARLWTAETGQVVAVLKGHTSSVSHVVFSPGDGHQIVTASWDDTARLWDAETGQVVAVLNGHKNLVYHTAFSPDGRKIVTASDDSTARLWKIYSTKELVEQVKSLDLPPLTPEERRQNNLP